MYINHLIQDIDKEPDMIIKLLNILNELEEIVLMPLKPPGHKLSSGKRTQIMLK